ncbi:MAG: carbohydrate kinase family protein [Chloroflexota bacterium]
MAKIIIAGLINVETTVKVEEFPIAYEPVRFAFHGVKSTVSGVGYNISKALTTLGHDVDFISLVGEDITGQSVRTALAQAGISDKHVLSLLDETPQSAILYDGDGKRMIHSDLKTIQETDYPLEKLNLRNVDLAVLANINFSRPMLAEVKEAGISIATDIHTIISLDDDYNRDYMQMADILFMSDERLPTSAEKWIQQLWQRHQTAIIGIGLGAAGALVGVHETQYIKHIPAKALRPIVNTIGSGDALFSSFLHSYIVDGDPIIAMQKAVLFAGYKIGSAGGNEGFLTAEQLDHAYNET